MKIHYKTETEITCSDCGHTARETMPLDACTYFYECRNCTKLMKPESGDCCVFCSHGTTSCPTSQRESRAYSILQPGLASANEETVVYDSSSAIQTG
ncbi:MAG: GDCCVxC domain-containing (seleno)protein [Endozoicomonas sp.]